MFLNIVHSNFKIRSLFFNQGDSGGPAAFQFEDDREPVVVGVASFVLSSGIGAEPSVCINSEKALSFYTRVSYFIDWIKDVMDGSPSDF